MVVDTANRTVKKNGQLVDLTAREYTLVELLALNRGCLVSRSMVYDHVFDENEDSLSNLVDVHIYNIRKRRSQPGLRPQHLEAVLTAAKLCNAEVNGATLSSQELWFRPNKIVGGRVEAAIGTAGSIPMLLLTIYLSAPTPKKQCKSMWSKVEQMSDTHPPSTI